FPSFGPGGELTNDQAQEIQDRIRERYASGGMGGPGGGPMAGGPGGGFGGGGFGGPGGGFGGGGGGFGGPGGGFGGRGGGFGGQAVPLGNPNRLRGSLYENYSNSVFDARQYSFSGLEQPKGSYNLNSFGANLG